MKVSLPDGAWADLISRDDITEKVYRQIDRALTKTIFVTAGMIERGYEEPSKWPELPEPPNFEDFHGPTSQTYAEAKMDYDRRVAEREAKNLKNLRIATSLSDEEQDIMDDYQMKLILGLTRSWSFDSDVSEESVLALPRPTFEALAEAAQSEMRGTAVETDPDPNSTAPTGA